MDAKNMSLRARCFKPFSISGTHSFFIILTLFSVSTTTYADNLNNKITTNTTQLQANNIDQKQIAVLINQVFTDPGFAKKTARLIAYRHDDPAWIDRLPNLASNDFGSYKQKINLHDQNIQRIRAQRIDLYSRLKNKGVPDAEIFASIMEFNNRLPIGYLKQTNMYDYVSTAIKVIHNQSQRNQSQRNQTRRR